MVGLVIAGPWFTWATARLFGSMSRGAAPLLASRRLADNPKAAFRSVTGLVLAVFLGTIVGTLVPAVNATEASPTSTALSNVLLDQVGMSGPAGARLIAGLSAIGGANVYPFYAPGSPDAGTGGPGGGPSGQAGKGGSGGSAGGNGSNRSGGGVQIGPGKALTGGATRW